MKKILIFTTSESHLSVSQSLEEILKKADFKIRLKSSLLFQNIALYTSFYRYCPLLIKIPYEIARRPLIQRGVKIFLNQWLGKKVKEEINNFQPDLIFTNHCFYHPVISKVLNSFKKAPPFINLIANPWSIHPFEFSAQVSLNLVYDQKGVSIGQKNKIPLEKLLPLGWLVRNNFYQQYNLEILRKKLQFEKEIFTLLICGGSQGTNSILKIMPGLLRLKFPCQIIIVCGANQVLYHGLKSFNQNWPRLRKNRIKLFKFTHQLPQLMSLADLVIGKAGPNLLFETVARQKPFLAICHIPGQEDGNLDLIKKKRLGFVEENSLKAVKLLKKIMAQPQILKEFAPTIQKTRRYNLKAEKKLLETVKNLILADV